MTVTVKDVIETNKVDERLEVIGISQSLRDLERGISGFYLDLNID